MKNSIVAITLSAVSCLAFQSANAALLDVYSNDFDGNELFGSGVTGGLTGITTTETINTLGMFPPPAGFSGDMLVNDSGDRRITPTKTTLTLVNLPEHDSVDINFLLMFINSWDGVGGSFGTGPGPDGLPQTLNDKLLVDVDGVNILDISNDNGDNFVDYAGAHLTVNGNIFEHMHVRPPNTALGFKDSAYDMGPESLLTIAHTASTLTLDIYAGGPGWQGGGDESWGMENVQIGVNVVPIPPALWLLGSGLLGLVGMARRRKT